MRNDSIVVLRFGLGLVPAMRGEERVLGMWRIVEVLNYTKNSRDKEFFVILVVRVGDHRFRQNIANLNLLFSISLLLGLGFFLDCEKVRDRVFD